MGDYLVSFINKYFRRQWDAMRHQEFKLYSISRTHTTPHTCDMELFLTFATDNNSMRSSQ